MSSKIVVKLGEICDVRDGTHDSPKPKLNGRPLVTSKHIKNGSIDFSSANLISHEDFESVNKRSKVDKFDVLMSMIGTVGEMVFVEKEPEYAIKNIGLIKTGGNQLLGKYLYYYLKSPQAINHLSSVQAGSTQKFIGLGELRKFPIELWDETSQEIIVKILGDLDQKIELHRRMNETLEQIGQNLFEHYFIDNPESEGWEVMRLGEMVEVTDYVANGSFASLKENVTLYDSEEYAIYIRTTDFKNNFSNNLKYVNKKSFDFLKKSTLLGEEVIISNVGDVGTVFRPPVWLQKPMTLASNVVMLKPSKFNDYLFLYFNSNKGQFDISTITAGSAQPKFNKTEFRNLKITTPPSALLVDFNNIYTSLKKKQNNNFAQTAHLTSIRNLLLPKLMSGQISV